MMGFDILKFQELLVTYSNCGTLIAKRYNRIVIGDYGAFIEIEKRIIKKKTLKLRKAKSTDTKILIMQIRLNTFG